MSTEVVAKLLAGEQMSQDKGIREVYWAPAANEVRLVEISGSVEDTGELLPFRFSPDPPDVPFPQAERGPARSPVCVSALHSVRRRIPSVTFGSALVEESWNNAVSRYERGVRRTTQRPGCGVA